MSVIPATASGAPGRVSTEAAPRPPDRTMLFLIADTGGGHRASATAVAREVEADSGGRVRCILLDPFAEASPRLVGALVDLYAPLVRHAPWAWGALYHATDSRAAVRLLRASVLRLVEPGLRAAVAREQPAIVVSFHPLLNHLGARVLDRMPPPRPPMVTVVTDLVDVHAAWIAPDVDLVLTPSSQGLARCRRAGVAPERSADLGLPVAAAFCEPPAGDAERAALRRGLGLDPERFTLLLTGGGEGSGGLGRRLRALLRARLDLQIVVVCGRNTRLRRRLEGLETAGPTAVVVRGFVSNMAAWMRAADVAVTKAGPGTIAEALCSGTPLLLTSHLPGQERGNIAYVVSTGTGRYVPRIADMVEAVAALSTPGSPALAAMRAELGAAARPRAAARVAALLGEVADRAAASPPAGG